MFSNVSSNCVQKGCVISFLLFSVFKCLSKCLPHKRQNRIGCVCFLFVGVFFIVRYQMCAQMACLQRCKVTLAAFVWFLATVRFQMSPQIACKGTGIDTLIALVWLFSTVRTSFPVSHPNSRPLTARQLHEIGTTTKWFQNPDPCFSKASWSSFGQLSAHLRNQDCALSENQILCNALFHSCRSLSNSGAEVAEDEWLCDTLVHFHLPLSQNKTIVSIFPFVWTCAHWQEKGRQMCPASKKVKTEWQKPKGYANAQRCQCHEQWIFEVLSLWMFQDQFDPD